MQIFHLILDIRNVPKYSWYQRKVDIVVTIIDVANYAGVSKSTVSAVLNNGPHVKEETRRRVEEAVIALGYVCNNNARGLRKRETKCLGVIIAVESRDVHTYEFSFEAGQFGYAVANGIPDGLGDRDYGLITEQYCPREMAGELPAIIKNARVDGVFLVGSLFEETFLRKLQELSIPAVVVGTNYESMDCVLPDVAKGVRLQVEELVRCGARKIAMVNCPPEFTNAKLRINGWKQAVSDLDGKLNDTWEIQCRTNTGAGGYLAMKELWESGARPDGVVTAHEAIALGVMRYFHEQGVRVPKDVSVTSYETSVLGGYSIPPLTSVNIKKEEMGAIAARMLLNRIENPAAPLQNHVIDPELVARGSVAKK